MVIIITLVLFSYCNYSHKPDAWRSISHNMTKDEIYRLIGIPMDIDTEAGWESWRETRYNGCWTLCVRFFNGKPSNGNISFHNMFYDANWNPLPKPYSLSNFTTNEIP